MAVQEFDLTTCSRESYVNTRGVRLEFGLGGGLLAAAGLGILAYQAIHGTLVSSFELIYGLPYYVTFGGALLLAWGSMKFAPGATTLWISQDGVRFAFPGRPSTTLRWTDPRFRLDLTNVRVTPVAQKYGLEAFASIPGRPSTQLTGAALDALLTAAREHQLCVTSRARGGRWSFAGPLHEWIEIRGRLSR